MAIRVHGDPRAILPVLRRAITEVDPQVPVTEQMTMLDQVRGVFMQARLAAAVLLSASVLALVLSAVGLYGVVAPVRQKVAIMATAAAATRAVPPAGRPLDQTGCRAPSPVGDGHRDKKTGTGTCQHFRQDASGDVSSRPPAPCGSHC